MRTSKIIHKNMLGFIFNRETKGKSAISEEREQVDVRRELHEHPDVKPRLAFLFTPNQERLEGLAALGAGKINHEKVEKMLHSPDFIVREAATHLLSKVEEPKIEKKEATLKFLSVMITHADSHIRESAVKALTNFGEDATPILESVIKSETDQEVKNAAIRILGMNGKSALKILASVGKLSGNAEALCEALSHCGNDALPILEEMLRTKYAYGGESVPSAAYQAILTISVNESPNPVATLEGVLQKTRNNNEERIAAIKTLSIISERKLALGILKRLRKRKRVSIIDHANPDQNNRSIRRKS